MEAHLVAWTLLSVLLGSDATEQLHLDNRSMLITELFAGYDKQTVPRPLPVTVGFRVLINDLYGLDENTMDFNVKHLMTMYWNDKRLKFPGTRHDADEFVLLIAEEAKSLLWRPSVYFKDEKSTNSLKPDDLSDSNTYTSLYSNGHIEFSLELTTNFRCSLDLRNYPLDVQICHVKIESFLYYTDKVRFVWRPGNFSSVALGDEISLNSFELHAFRNKTCDYMDQWGENPCVKIEFQFTRQIGFYVLQFFMPCMLIVVLSWISFWVTMTIGEHIALGLLLLLTISTLNFSAQSNLPKVSYVKALDVWFLGCTLFLIATLLQAMALAHFSEPISDPGDELNAVLQELVRELRSEGGATGRRGVQTVEGATRAEMKPEGENGPDPNRIKRDAEEAEGKRRQQLVHRAFMASKILNPVLFLLFNVAFWVHYVNAGPELW